MIRPLSNKPVVHLLLLSIAQYYFERPILSWWTCVRDGVLGRSSVIPLMFHWCSVTDLCFGFCPLLLPSPLLPFPHMFLFNLFPQHLLPNCLLNRPVISTFLTLPAPPPFCSPPRPPVLLTHSWPSRTVTRLLYLCSAPSSRTPPPTPSSNAGRSDLYLRLSSPLLLLLCPVLCGLSL